MMKTYLKESNNSKEKSLLDVKIDERNHMIVHYRSGIDYENWVLLMSKMISDLGNTLFNDNKDFINDITVFLTEPDIFDKNGLINMDKVRGNMDKLRGFKGD